MAFPMDRSEQDCGPIILSHIDQLDTIDLSSVIWLFLDGGISVGYNSHQRGKVHVTSYRS